jgi:F-type H+-transporting ATPase subunit gamma
VSQRDVKQRIAAIGNIQKITRAMEMVAAARLRRAEERISTMRPYADALAKMTRQAAAAAGSSELKAFPALQPRDEINTVALLLVTADRGLAGAFNSQIVRAGLKAAADHEAQGRKVVFYATGRRGVSSLTFRNKTVIEGFTGFTERPGYADARNVAETVMAAYIDGDVDHVEVFYNRYVSVLTQEPTNMTLLPLQENPLEIAEGEDTGHHALVEYEPEPEAILARLIPDYIETTLFRALLESSASELGARMTAMRSASENAGELIDTYTLQMNRARQAEITQEIMEVVAGAESLV